MTLRISSLVLVPASLLLFACPVDSNDDVGDSDDSTMTASSTMTAGTTVSTTVTTSDPDSSDSGSGDTAPADVDYATDIQPIWTANCITGCHETGGIYAALAMGAATSYASLLDQKPVYSSDANFVVPGDASASLLIRGLRGTDAILRPMPLLLSTDENGMAVGVEGTPLPEADIAKVEAWINAGAAE